MRIGAKGLVLIAAGFISVSGAFGAAKVTLTGWVSDSKCGAGHGAKDPDPDCVAKCIKGGAKPVFVDASGKVWDIDDPDAVKGHYGHHVLVYASVDPAAKSVHVVKVTMLAQQ